MTKALKLPDTEPGKPLKLELVLYVDYDEKSRIVDRTSVDINIGNQANIPIPNSGIRLRYTFVPGTRMIYRLEARRFPYPRCRTSTTARVAAPQEFTADGETIRMAYEVMNSYGDGDGLLRNAAAAGKRQRRYALLTVNNQPQSKFFDYEMAPIYMRIHSTGQEVFGSIPGYVPMEGSGAGGSRTDLSGRVPFRHCRASLFMWATPWQSAVPRGRYRFEQPVRDGDDHGAVLKREASSSTPSGKVDTRAPRFDTASKRRKATSEGKKLKAQGAQFSDDKVSLEETIWFALDTH